MHKSIVVIILMLLFVCSGCETYSLSIKNQNEDRVLRTIPVKSNAILLVVYTMSIYKSLIEEVYLLKDSEFKLIGAYFESYDSGIYYDPFNVARILKKNDYWYVECNTFINNIKIANGYESDYKMILFDEGWILSLNSIAGAGDLIKISMEKSNRIYALFNKYSNENSRLNNKTEKMSSFVYKLTNSSNRR